MAVEAEFDPDFQARASSEEEPEPSGEDTDEEAPRGPGKRRSVSKPAPPPVQPIIGKAFQRAKIRQPLAGTPPAGTQQMVPAHCLACNNRYGLHAAGFCPVKLAGPEYCNLCAQAHYGTQGSCPHLKSEEKIRASLRALENSPEDKNLVDMARRQMKIELANVVQEKKRKHDATLSNTKSSIPATPRSTNGINSNVPNPSKKRATTSASGNYPQHNTPKNIAVTQNGLPKTVVYGSIGISKNHQPLHAPSQSFGPTQGQNGLGRDLPFLNQTMSGALYRQHTNPQSTPYDAFYAQANGLPTQRWKPRGTPGS